MKQWLKDYWLDLVLVLIAFGLLVVLAINTLYDLRGCAAFV